MVVSNTPEPWAQHYAHPCAWDLTFEPLALTEMFTRSAGLRGNAPLADFMGRAYSYCEIHTEALHFAAGLQAMGIGKGDRVGLFLPNVPIYISAYYGALMAGATVVNMSPLYTPAELAAQLEDSGARVIVTVNSAALLPAALEVLGNSRLERLVIGDLPTMLPALKGLAMRWFLRRQLADIPQDARIRHWADMLLPDAPSPVAIDATQDLALLQYTGGTTGTPKGAMLSHQNLSANARQLLAIDIHRGERDVVLAALPLFHVFANSCILNRTVANGGCMVMLPRFDAGQVLKAISRTRPTSIFAVPTMLQALLDHPEVRRTNFTSVRGCIVGGAPLARPLEDRFEAATGVRVLEGYGLTESSGVVTSNPLQAGDHAGTIGQPLPATRLRLLDKDDPTRDAPADEPGELVVRGPQIMQGYWNRPDAAASAFADLPDGRWLRTGDIAMIDADGYVRIVDRSKDMISVGGFKVFPSQVEAVLLENPAVKEVLVIGMPDAYRGEVPRAFATLTAHADETSGDALRDWLNARIGKHERVDAVILRDSLPKTMIGKLDRKALRAEISELNPPG